MPATQMSKKPRQVYDPYRKQIAVHLNQRHGSKKTAELLGIDITNIYRWKKSVTIADGPSLILEESAQTTVQRPIEELLGMPVFRRNDEENIFLFKEGNQPAYHQDPMGQPTGAQNPLAEGTGQPNGLTSESEAWFMENVDAQLLKALSEIDCTHIPDNALDVFNNVSGTVDSNIPDEARHLVADTLEFGLRLRDGNRSKKTKENWQPRKRRFMHFWLKVAIYFATRRRDANGDHPVVEPLTLTSYKKAILVSEQKLLTWIRFDSLRRNPNQGWENINHDIKAISDLWKEQNTGVTPVHPPIKEGIFLQAFAKKYRTQRSMVNSATFVDRAKGTMADGYSAKDLPQICDWLTKDTINNRDGMRNRVLFLALHMFMGRSEDFRQPSGMISDLQLREFGNERPQAMNGIIMNIRESKTNSAARNEVGATMRCKDENICFVGALASFFFQRFTIREEPWPDLSQKKSWYHISMLNMNYDQQNMAIKRLLDGAGIYASNVTHAPRGSASRICQEAGVPNEAIKIHGRWCGSQLENRYLSRVALEPIRVLAGFGRQGGDCWMARHAHEPPEALQQMVFPKLCASEEMLLAHSHVDRQALCFIELMKYLAVVFLQDSVPMMARYPNLPLWDADLFKTTQWTNWRAFMSQELELAVCPFDSAISSIVPEVADSLNAVRAQMQTVENKLTGVQAMQSEIENIAKNVDEMRQEVQQLTEITNIQRREQIEDRQQQTADQDLAQEPDREPVASSSSIGGVPPSSDALPESYTLCTDIKTVTELWKEWDLGYRGGPAVKLLEERRMSEKKGWHGTVAAEYKKNGKQWTRRKYIIETARNLSEKYSVSGAVIAEKMEVRRMEMERMGGRLVKGRTLESLNEMLKVGGEAKEEWLLHMDTVLCVL